jgi:hypothetical protein
MDVRRLQLWEGRKATMLSNETLRCVIEDQGGMVLELSNSNAKGGRLNAHPLYWFHGKGPSLGSDENHEFWRDNTLLYHLAGNFLCFPNFGGGHVHDSISHEPHGWTANEQWCVVKYGTDFETGANWLLSSMFSPNPNYPFEAWKIDMLLPGHPVLYTSVSIKNTGEVDLPANTAWHNTVGSPFLETGCVIDLCAQNFMTALEKSEFELSARLAFGKEFSDLTKAPLQKEGTCNLSEVPGMIGHTDFITGVVPRDAKLGWSSVINPRQQMVYFSFFPGPAVVTENEIPLNFNDLWMQYGGRPMTPWALYDGGTDQTFCLGVENATGYFANGLGQSIQNPSLLGAPTSIMIPQGEVKVQRYGTAFCSYDNPKMSAGVQSVEQVVEGVVLKRGKAWAFIESDTTFHFLKKMEEKLLTS